MPSCPDCGTENDPGRVHCSNCSARLREDPLATSQSLSCAACGTDLERIVFECRGCSEQFCRDHREADAHDCSSSAPGYATVTPEELRERATREGEPTEVGSEREAADTGSRVLDRRTVVAGVVGLAAGAYLVSTFGSDAPPHRPAEDGAWSDVERERSGRSVRTSATASVPPGRFAARSLEPRNKVDYSLTVSVREGGPIDVFVFPARAFERYRETYDYVDFLDTPSATETSEASLGGTLDPGSYRLVVDNTGAYFASPSGTAVVEVALEVTPRSSPEGSVTGSR